MYNFEDMVTESVVLYNKETTEHLKKEFLDTPKKNLVRYHTTLGKEIRNRFKLWDTNWKPDIRDGVDCSPDHPDQISMRVVQAVWDRLQSS